MTARQQPAWRTKRPWLADTVICDGLLPWANHFLPPGANLAQQLRRFWEAGGVDHDSLTAGAGSEGPVEALARLGLLRRELAPHAAWVREARDPAAAHAAKEGGCLSVSFHIQSATPFAPGLDLVDAFKAAGIIRAILAYNEASVFADGCHEPRNAGLSAYGRQLVARNGRSGHGRGRQPLRQAHQLRRDGSAAAPRARVLALERAGAVRP